MAIETLDAHTTETVDEAAPDSVETSGTGAAGETVEVKRRSTAVRSAAGPLQLAWQQRFRMLLLGRLLAQSARR